MLALPASSAEEQQADADARLNGVQMTAPEQPWYAGMGPGLAGRGFGEGIAQTGSALEAAMEPVRDALPEGIQQTLFGVSGEELKQKEALQKAQIDGIVSDLRPDPAVTGAAGRTLEGLQGFIGQATAGSMVAGPAGAFGVVAGSQGHDAYQEMLSRGVDPKTAAEVAGVTGLTSGVMAVSPMAFGSKLLTKALSGAGINLTSDVASRYANGSILDANGYHDMGQQTKQMDKWSALSDIVLGGFFGAFHQGNEDKGIPSDAVKPSDADAAMAVKSAQQYADAAPGIPADAKAAAAHDQAMKTAMSQVLNDEPVNVGGIPDGEMLPRAHDPELIKAWQEATNDAGLDEVSRNLQEAQAHVQDIGVPTGEASNYDALLSRAALQPEIKSQIVKHSEAVTPQGQSLPVDYAVVSANDLISSHNNDLSLNPAYPVELQPRDRSRSATQLQINTIMNPNEFKPALLGETAEAGAGTPIVGPEGYVESGNARTIALRRAYEENSPVAQMYQDYLKQQGYPTEGIDKPVLVRINRSGMSMPERAAFAVQANKDMKLRMSSTEQALADAKQVPDDVMLKARAGDFMAASNRDFVRGVLQSIASPGEMGNLITSDGYLSQEGLRRVQGAVLAKAYGDAGMMGTLLESTESNYRAIGNALIEAAPEWAKMRSAIASGTIPAAYDVTPNLVEAINIISKARASGRAITDFTRQFDILSGTTVHPFTEKILGWMMRGENFTRAKGQPIVADTLRFYAQEAQKAVEGVNLFGEKTGAKNVEELIDLARSKFEKTEPRQQSDFFRQPDGASPVREVHDNVGSEEQRSGIDQDRAGVGAPGAADRSAAASSEPGSDIGRPKVSTSKAETLPSSQSLPVNSSTDVKGTTERRNTRYMPFSYSKYLQDLIPDGTANSLSMAKSVDKSFINDSGALQYQQSRDKQTLLQQAKEKQPDLVNLINNVTKDVDGAQPYRKGNGTRIKADSERLDQKIGKKKGNAGAISDYLGGGIEVNSPEAIAGVIRNIKESGIKVIEAEDMLSHIGSRNPYAYRAVHMQVDLGDGFSAELQLLPKPVADIKDELHTVYEKYRTAEAQERVKTDEVFAQQQQRDSQIARAKYQEAYQKFIKASITGEGLPLKDNVKKIPLSYKEEANSLISPDHAQTQDGKTVDSRISKGDITQYQAEGKGKRALLNAAEKNKDGYADWIKNLTDGIGAKPYSEGEGGESGVRVKKPKGRLDEKIADKGGNAGAISDYLGGAIEVKTPEDLTALLQRIRNSGKRILEVDDMLTQDDKPKDDGYRALHMQVELQPGFSAELQILPEGVAKIKEQMHAEYVKYREPEDEARAQTDPAFAAKMQAAKDKVSAAYQKAFDDFVAKSKTGEGQPLPTHVPKPAKPLDATGQILADKPDMTVPTPDGEMNVQDLVGKADKAVDDAEKQAQLFQVAVDCAMRNAT